MFSPYLLRGFDHLKIMGLSERKRVTFAVESGNVAKLGRVPTYVPVGAVLTQQGVIVLSTCERAEHEDNLFHVHLTPLAEHEKHVYRRILLHLHFVALAIPRS
jgi:hypothetical protein